MSTVQWCILAACAIPVLTVGLAKASSVKLPSQEGRYDNNNPRAWEHKLTGWQQRANAAQANGFEALPLFIAGVLMAQMAHADQSRIDMLAMAFVGLRLAYVAAYLANQGTLRTLIWTAGLGVSIALLFLGT